jgi:hypothetical protein
VKVAVDKEHLFSRFESWYPEVGAVGTAEGITQVAVLIGQCGLGILALYLLPFQLFCKATGAVLTWEL